VQLLLLGTDEAWATTLVRRFATRGHAIEWQRDATRAARWLGAHRVDVVLVDLQDAAQRGMRDLVHLRRLGHDAPLLGFAPSGRIGERIRALDLGADDCQAWPCDLDELEARCRVLLRRGLGLAEEVFRHDGFHFEPAAHRASVDGAVLPLPRREFALLRILVGRFGRAVSKQEIGRLLFNAGEAVGSNAVELYIGRLRRRLAGARVRIHTVRGVGYRLEPCTPT